jgi:hypothetical protein
MTATTQPAPEPDRTGAVTAYVSDPVPQLEGDYKLRADYNPDPVSNPFGGSVSLRLRAIDKPTRCPIVVDPGAEDAMRLAQQLIRAAEQLSAEQPEAGQ